MTEAKKNYTGAYVFGSHETNISFGGAFGTITLPSYSKQAQLYLNDDFLSKNEKWTVQNYIVSTSMS